MRQETKYIVIHCSQTRPSQKIGAKEIDRWHREKGWLKIGYAIVIKRDGTIEQGREDLLYKEYKHPLYGPGYSYEQIKKVYPDYFEEYAGGGIAGLSGGKRFGPPPLSGPDPQGEGLFSQYNRVKKLTG